MKKIIIGLILLVLSLGTFLGCGGGAGSPSSPSGENGGTPSIVQLQPSHFVAQTNTSITLHAKVLDGNGAPVANTLVTFTNLSPIGVLSSTTAETNGSSIATVTLKSTIDGFSTVQAEVSKDVGQARDRKTMFFSSFSTAQFPTPPLLTLSVDDGDGIPNEPGDFILNNAVTNQRLITATVSIGGIPVKGSKVTFGADRAFKVGTDPLCSDGRTTCEVIFPQGNTATTNDLGDASVLVEVKPTASSFIEPPLNITALADNGAFNLVTLLFELVQSVTVSATPTSVAPDGTSTITAAVTMKTGGPAPDGTTVNFTATCGSIAPFAQTTLGAATADFTAPSTTDICTITATAGGVHDSIDVTITAALKVFPDSVKVSAPSTVTLTILGGSIPYRAFSSSSHALVGPISGSPAHFSVTIDGDVCTPSGDPSTCSSDITITIVDSKGATATSKITATIP